MTMLGNNNINVCPYTETTIVSVHGPMHLVTVEYNHAQGRLVQSH